MIKNNRCNRQSELTRLTSSIISTGSNPLTRFWSAISKDKYFAGDENARNRKYKKTILNIFVSIKDLYNGLELEVLKSGDAAFFSSAKILDKISKSLDLVKTNVAGYEHIYDPEMDHEKIKDLFIYVNNIYSDFKRNKDKLGEVYSSYIEKINALKESFDSGNTPKDKKVYIANAIGEVYNDLLRDLKSANKVSGDNLNEILFNINNLSNNSTVNQQDRQDKKEVAKDKAPQDISREEKESMSDLDGDQSGGVKAPKGIPVPAPPSNKSISDDVNVIINDYNSIKDLIDRSNKKFDRYLKPLNDFISEFEDQSIPKSQKQKVSVGKIIFYYKKLIDIMNLEYRLNESTLSGIVNKKISIDDDLMSRANFVGLQKQALSEKWMLRMKNKMSSDEDSAIKLEVSNIAKINKKLVDDSLNLLESTINTEDINLTLKELSRNNSHIRRLIMPFLKGKDFSNQFADMIGKNKIMDYDKLSESEIKRLNRMLELKKIRDITKLYDS